MLTGWFELVLLGVAGFLSGMINAVAGGGSLLVFPSLLATGMSPLVANVTNSVAQGPGFVGAVTGQRRDLADNRQRLVPTSIAAALGSTIGCFLLLTLPASVFDAVVPALVGLSAVLMALQKQIKRWLGDPGTGQDRSVLLTVGIFLASIYGGYFGGARSVILIVILVLTAHAPIGRLNVAKNWLSLVGSLVTLVVYALLAPVQWLAVLALVPTTLVGGYLGSKVAQRLPATALRYLVVAIAAAVAVYMVVD